MKVSVMFTKCQVIEHALASFANVMVTLDARVEGVLVPGYLRTYPTLTLAIGLNLNPAVLDLEATESFLRATLSFSGEAFHCRIPMRAIYRISLGDDLAIWPLDVPKDAVVQTGVDTMTQEPHSEISLSPPTKSPRSSHLKLVP